MNSDRDKPEDLVQALSYIFEVCKYFMLSCGYIENWVVILNAADANFLTSTFDASSVVSKIVVAMYTYFPCYLDKIYVWQPSFTFNTLWGLVKSNVDIRTREKIELVDPKNAASLQKFYRQIPKDQLEKKFGGHQYDLSTFWPPTNSLNTATFAWMNNNIHGTMVDTKAPDAGRKTLNVTLPTIDDSKLAEAKQRNTSIDILRERASTMKRKTVVATRNSWKIKDEPGPGEEKGGGDFCGLSFSQKNKPKVMKPPGSTPTPEDEGCSLI